MPAGYGIVDVFIDLRNVYRGWSKFRRENGIWPIYSILTAIFSIPLLFAAALYVFAKAFDSAQRLLIYGSLGIIPIAGLIWWWAHRFASELDLRRVHRRVRESSVN